MAEHSYLRARSRASIRRRRALLIGAAAALVVAASVAGTLAWTAFTADADPDSTAAPTIEQTPEPTRTPPPLTAAERLLREAGDANACAVSFEGEGIDQAPILQQQGFLFNTLPLPAKEGAVFAGWYATPEDAAARTVAGRVNGSRIVECVDQEVTLHGAWVTPDENIAENAQIPILMYHQFTLEPEGEPGWLRLNYAYIGDFDAQMKYIADSGFYLPTWDELGAFIDGRLFLPNHSVIITDDDADWTWFDYAAPVIDKYKLLTTSFMVTAWRQNGPPNPYTLVRSHSNDMHRAGSDGEGRILTMPHDEIVADLEESARIIGAKEIFAYPFGDHDEAAKQAVADAGYELARTIDQGYVHVGSDKLALPCIRINYGMGADALANLIG